MQATFLLGPAGGGKTHRCLAEIRAELAKAPEGLPLVLIAPKQATFQLERQLLADGSLAGYTRLQILSFERLAGFVLSEFASVPAKLLDEEGRVMVLRALLARKQSELRAFRASARLPGFARQLELLLRELQRHQISPEGLLALAENVRSSHHLGDKLRDVALLLRSYIAWLNDHQLQDANCLLDLAATALRSLPEAARSTIRFGGLWLDGFAEMTPQELDFLAQVVPLCERATLAFCLEREPAADLSWLSTWSVVGASFRSCRQRLASLPDCAVKVEILERIPPCGRFTDNPALAHLEKHWENPRPFDGTPQEALRIAICRTPEEEAVLAAREILRHARSGGRFRDCAVLLRTLEGYDDVLRRVFRRYEIPFFLDRREPVAHHPLAELTRCALRVAAFGWEHDDWFGALKSGLVTDDEDGIDRLENAALARGWKRDTWLQPLEAGGNELRTERLEQLRQKIVPPFQQLAAQLAAETPGWQGATTGSALAAALREFWNELEVGRTLEKWSADESNLSTPGAPHRAIHTTVWDQMQSWLDSLELAFENEPLPLRDWLPILEAGLSGLTVGVIPPTLDQVLVGTIDRSRNPDLKLALVPGLNESVFPAAPAADPLLTAPERESLAAHGAALGSGQRLRLGHERYFGYIAFTRARQRLVLSCASVDMRGRKLNHSPFLDHLRRLFPQLNVEEWQTPAAFVDAEHFNEIIAPAIQLQNREPTAPVSELFALPRLGPILAKANQVRIATASQQVSPALAEALHGRELATSLTALEDFAACPFKFFAGHGLDAAERKRFEPDARERGTLQHEVLAAFHRRITEDGRKWRDISPAEARVLARGIGRDLLPQFHHGVFLADEARRFAGELLLESLETLVEVLVTWARDYQFDPACVEAAFGLPGAPWPAWRLDLEDGRALLIRGRIDRVDVWRDTASGAALVVVMDYKSSGNKADRVKLHHGLQLQLPAYLAALEHLPEARQELAANQLVAAGAFFVNLRGEFRSTGSRAEALDDPAAALRKGYQHAGRFDETFVKKLDPFQNREQFRTHSNAHDPMRSAAFRELLDRAVLNLRRFGSEVLSGKVAPDPYRRGLETACQNCDYASICRFDPWTQPFRPLSEPPVATAADAAPKSKRPKQARNK